MVRKVYVSVINYFTLRNIGCTCFFLQSRKAGRRLTFVSSPLYDFVIQEVSDETRACAGHCLAPFNLAESFEKLAKAESKNKSQLFREMLTDL